MGKGETEIIMEKVSFQRERARAKGREGGREGGREDERKKRKRAEIFRVKRRADRN